MRHPIANIFAVYLATYSDKHNYAFDWYTINTGASNIVADIETNKKG